MTGAVTGTLGELRAIRAYWARLAPAAAALRELGFADQAAEVAAIAKVIGAARFAVPLPCLICHRPEPVDVAIGDPHKAEPGAVICGSCSAEIDARVAALMAAPASPYDLAPAHARGHMEPRASAGGSCPTN